VIVAESRQLFCVHVSERDSTLRIGIPTDEPRVEFDLITAGIVGGIAAFSILIAVGLIVRTTWGRVLGIIFSFLCFLPLLVGLASGSPASGIIQAVIGIFGLMALFRSPRLFGPNRVRGAEIKAELKHRKMNRIA
jgi:hypothetical protein